AFLNITVPQPNFVVLGPRTGCYPFTVTFLNSSTSNAQIVRYFWDFGDGTTSTEDGPLHDFVNAGFYTVTLTIFAGNCTSTTSQGIAIFDPNDCQDCPDIFAPVCVINFNGELITFDNECFAICAGFDPEHFFDCGNDCFCPTFEAPVCVLSDAGDTLTYTNHCFAECDGYGPDAWFDCNDPNGCYCPEYFDPVCVVGPEGDTLTFDNICFAECEGYGADQVFECFDNGECDCFPFEEPICVIGPNGDTLTFSNFCYAQCEGYGPDTWFDCNQPTSCDCPPENNPVCVSLDSITAFVFPNPCVAECFGYGEDVLQDCEDFTCVCTDEYNPVCISTSDGTIITFSNPCEAECYGFGPEDFVSCEGDPQGCEACPQYFEPVCVINDAGDTLSFQNICFAECAGYPNADPGLCSDCGCEYSPDDVPVCVFDPVIGSLVSFNSLCEALCAGVPIELLQECPVADDCFAYFDYIFIDDSGLTVQFVAGSALPDSTDITWSWDFGDGSTGEGQEPTHTYVQPGVYTVILTIDSEDCSYTTSLTLVIGEDNGTPPTIHCQAFFFFEQPDPENLLTYQFVSLSLGQVDSWSWDFGNGDTSNEPNPFYTFPEEGSYQVSLTITSADSCVSTIAIVVNAGDNIWYGDLECRAWFLPLISPDSNSVYLLNLSSYDAITYYWDLGDGTTSLDYEAFHQYTEPGIYTISLTITTEDGCQNTYTVTIDLEEDGFVSNPQFSLINSTDEFGPTNMVNYVVAPNPTSDRVNVSWDASQFGQYDWQLFDLNGKRISNGIGQSVIGDTRFEVDLSNTPAGIYFLRIASPDGTQTMRVSKQ
ncbi:MAG: PKD domain-containing protein, partial [Bacteroidota bacterium]